MIDSARYVMVRDVINCVKDGTAKLTVLGKTLVLAISNESQSFSDFAFSRL